MPERIIQHWEELYQITEQLPLPELPSLAWVRATDEAWLDFIRHHPDRKHCVASAKTLPDRVLEVLASDTDTYIRSMIASKRRLPSKIREQLARDADPSVRAEIARGAKTPRELVERLTNDPERWVAEVAREALGKRHGDTE